MSKKIMFAVKGVIVEFQEGVLQTMKSHRQINALNPEAGGIITGKIFENKILVTGFSLPNRFDSASRFSFLRSKVGAQKIIDQKFFDSTGTEIYLGEWHTHPEEKPNPSSTDIHSFRRTIKKNTLNSNIFFLVIIGLSQIYISAFDNNGILIKDEFFAIL